MSDGPLVDLLIIGAGPFGLSMAAHAQQIGIDYMILGKSMGFWKDNMPAGMVLRSACDWHLDTANVDTIERFLQTQGLKPADVEPLSLRFYLTYVAWFQEQKNIEPAPVCVQCLDHWPGEVYPFRAVLEYGGTIQARRVVLAPGFKPFKNVPLELTERLPIDRFSHTCDMVDFAGLKGKRCLILGGRQSAFEWAALLHEAGASAVHISYRHASPAFAKADWSWVNPLVDAMVDNPGWYRNLSQPEKDDISHRLWAEGRLKIEPWLESRVMKEMVHLWPNTVLAGCDVLPNSDLAVQLDNGQLLTVDHVILATGYKVQIDQAPVLAQGNILDQLATRNGFPVLDEHFQTSVPGLFITSIAATHDFGPFFAFTVSVRTSAKLIGRMLVQPSSPFSVVEASEG
jgi:thioredoxin reductase